MKRLFLFMIMMISLIGVVGCTSGLNQDVYAFSDLEEMNLTQQVIDEDDINQLTDHPRLKLYIDELKETRNLLETKKADIRLLLEDTKTLRDNLKTQEITLSEADREVVIDALKSIRFNRFMLLETTGDAYQQLLDIRNNRDQYSQDQIKETLIDVYHVLKTRQAIYDDVYQDLEVIHNILLNY